MSECNKFWTMWFCIVHKAPPSTCVAFHFSLRSYFYFLRFHSVVYCRARSLAIALYVSLFVMQTYAHTHAVWCALAVSTFT